MKTIRHLVYGGGYVPTVVVTGLFLEGLVVVSVISVIIRYEVPVSFLVKQYEEEGWVDAQSK